MLSACVLLVEGVGGQRALCELAPTGETRIGGPADDLDLGEGRTIATVKPVGETWQLTLPGEGSPVTLAVGAVISAGRYRWGLIETGDHSAILDEESYLASVRDPLTRVYTRRFLAIQARRLEPETAVALLDLDHFKRMNDVHGLQVGDRVLVMTAQRIVAQVWWPEFVVRVGGEEFLVVLRASSRDRARDRAEAIRSAIESPFEIDGELLMSTVSIGVAMLGPGPDALEAAWRRADDQVALAKLHGRNRVIVE